MHGDLSKKGLATLEAKIYRKLNGRNPKSENLENSLKKSIGKYSYEVKYYYILHAKRRTQLLLMNTVQGQSHT